MEVLGRSYIQWIDIVQFCRDHYPLVSENWKNYGKSSGWTLQLIQKDQAILFLFPNKNSFYTLFIIDEKILQTIQNEDFPVEIMKQIEAAKSYQTEKSFCILVRSAEDVEWVKKIIRIKMQK
jgi:hypothetical protein